MHFNISYLRGHHFTGSTLFHFPNLQRSRKSILC